MHSLNENLTQSQSLRSKLKLLQELRERRQRLQRKANYIPLVQFVREAWPLVEPGIAYRHGMHIEAICLHLEHATRTPNYNLRINIPPGCMKSILCCVMWPAWVWGPYGWPESRWMFASYSAELSTRDSVRTRALIESDWYQSRWNVSFAPDENRKTRYKNLAGGWRFSTSVGGGGTGEHPDFKVIDDPHNVKQSESDVERQTALDWFDGTMLTRGRSRGARTVGVMQRLHENDWSGHVANREGWDALVLPMRAEPGAMKPTSIGWQDPRAPGELLFPELFDEAAVSQLERDMGSVRAAGQLQQRPAPADGGLFKREHFKFISQWPAGIKQAVRYWDKAGTPGGGDWSVGVLIGEGDDGQWYVLDVVRGQWSPLQRDKVILETAKVDAARIKRLRIVGEQEPGSAGVESAERFVRMLAGYAARSDKVQDSKRVRWMPWAAAIEAGMVTIVTNPAWNQAFVDEHIIAPNGAHDDQIDAAAGAYAFASGKAGVDLNSWLDRI